MTVDKNDIINSAVTYFSGLKPAANKPKLRPVKMTINGQTIITSSGKAVWKRIGDAKNALRLEFDKFWGDMKQDKYQRKHYQYIISYDMDEKLKREAYQFVLTNLIRFEDA